MQVCKQFKFETAHRLMEHTGLCINIHGHSFLVDVILEWPLNDMDMVIDFQDLKPIQDRIDQNFDHTDLYREDDEVWVYLKEKWFRTYCTWEFNPTSERISWILLLKCSELFPNLKIISVDVHETAKAFARNTL